MQEPYEIIESYLAGNVSGRTQIPYGAGVHQEAICHRGGKLASPPSLPDSERCTDGCVPSETKARRIKAGLSDELGIYLNFDPDSAGVGVQHGSG